LIIIWLIAPSIPTKQDAIIIIFIKLFLVNIIRIIGAIFCHVRIRKICIHCEVWITWGSQKWKGAAPILMERDSKIIQLIAEKVIRGLFKVTIIEAKIIKREAIAWAIKYLIVDSVEWGVILKISSGMRLIRLISNPSHAVNQDGEEHAIIVPVPRPIKYTLFLIVLNNKKSGKIHIKGVWAR